MLFRSARAAIQKLGLLPLGIPVGPGREPIWQSGVVGSISHCPGYCVAAVARSEDALSIGIDCEPNAPLPFDVVKMVLLPNEQSQIDGFDAGPIHWDRLVFSAKESVYKCWYPLMRDWLGFEEAMIVIDPDKFRFEVKLARSCQAPFGRFDRFAGRFIQCGEHLITAIVVPNG